MAIWPWAAGIDNFGAIVLGIGAHVVNLTMVGAAFALLLIYVVRARGVMTPVVLGVLYGLVIWVVMRYVILPLNGGEATLFTTDTVSPQAVWWLSHAVLGMTAGIYYFLVNRTTQSVSQQRFAEVS